MPDLGDTVTLRLRTYDSSGVLGAASSVTFVVTLPDGTTSTPTTVTESTGVYAAYYVPSQRGTHSWVGTATGGVVGSGGMVLEDSFTVTDVAGLVGIQEAQAFLGARSDSSQDEVRACLLAASDIVENYCGRKWRRQSVTETYDGGRSAISLRSTPVISVTTVTESGSTVTSGGYVLDQQAGILYRGTTAGVWPWMPGAQNVTVTYVTGATSIPQPVVYATKQVLAVLWADRQNGGKRSQPDDYAGPADLIPRPARLALDAYRAPGF